RMYEARVAADYDVDELTSADVAQECLGRARRFLATCASAFGEPIGQTGLPVSILAVKNDEGRSMNLAWTDTTHEIAGGKLHLSRAGSGRPLLILHHDIGTPDRLAFYD